MSQDPRETPETDRPRGPVTEPLRIIERGAEQLRRRYADLLGEDVVDRHVQDSLEGLTHAGTDPSHREHMAVRFADSRLRALTEAEGLVEPRVPRVLFVCVQNAGRSQLAAALLAERAGDAVEVRSAGSRPAAEVHGNVAPVLAGLGADPAETFPKPLTQEVLRAADHVVTLGCGDACEVPPGATLHDWPVGDPAEADWDRLQGIVADIEARVDDLWRRIQEDLEAGRGGARTPEARPAGPDAAEPRSTDPRPAVRRAARD